MTNNVIQLQPATVVWKIVTEANQWQPTMGTTRERPTEFPVAAALLPDGQVVVCPLSVATALCETVIDDFLVYLGF